MFMSLDTRQRAMLAEIGVRVWLPAPGASAEAVSMPATALSGSVNTEPPVARTLTPAPRPAALDKSVKAAPVPGTATAPVTDFPPLPAGLAQMDWAGLQQAAADCRACALCEHRNHSVFADGAPAADGQEIDWLIVGDAPADAEDASGKPFAGPEGFLLDAMLQAMGLARPGASASKHSVVLVNALKCRGPAQRKPLPGEIDACQHYLARQIALLRPRMILALGRLAAQAVLHDQLSDGQAAELPLGKLRGQVYQAHGCPVVVTYHPAYLLRSPADKARAWSDLCLAMSSLNESGSLNEDGKA